MYVDIYVYIYGCVCICTYIYVCVCVCIYIYIWFSYSASKAYNLIPIYSDSSYWYKHVIINLVILSVILDGPRKTHPKLIEWYLKVRIYKSKNLLNAVYVIYFGIFCKVSSQKIKHWTSYEIFSDGIDILLAEK